MGRLPFIAPLLGLYVAHTRYQEVERVNVVGKRRQDFRSIPFEVYGSILFFVTF